MKLQYPTGKIVFLFKKYSSLSHLNIDTPSRVNIRKQHVVRPCHDWPEVYDVSCLMLVLAFLCFSGCNIVTYSDGTIVLLQNRRCSSDVYKKVSTYFPLPPPSSMFVISPSYQ
jgi:hypothetical protein